MSMLGSICLRRSRYALSNRLPVPFEKLQHIVETCLLQAPSAFNMQSARLLVLSGEKHHSLWKGVLDQLRPHVPADQIEKTTAKINSFAAAYGTILYFIDEKVVRDMQQQFALYQENFPIWAQQENGMLQFSIWTALAESGIGASLQHYNPLIDRTVAELFQVAPEWKLIAQMPFGQPTAPADEKTYAPLSSRLRVE